MAIPIYRVLLYPVIDINCIFVPYPLLSRFCTLCVLCVLCVMRAHMLCMHVCCNFVLCHVCMDACVQYAHAPYTHVFVYVFGASMCLVLLGNTSRPPRGARW